MHMFWTSLKILLKRTNLLDIKSCSIILQKSLSGNVHAYIDLHIREVYTQTFYAYKTIAITLLLQFQ